MIISSLKQKIIYFRGLRDFVQQTNKSKKSKIFPNSAFSGTSFIRIPLYSIGRYKYKLI